jgi:hypothetical protein
LIPKDRDQRGPSFNTAFPIAETLDAGLLLSGGAAVYRFCFCFWVAQQFTAAVNALSSGRLQPLKERRH